MVKDKAELIIKLKKSKSKQKLLKIDKCLLKKKTFKFKKNNLERRILVNTFN